jgi:hypothetical protein
VLIPPGKDQRATMPPSLLKVIAEWHNRVETAFAEITDQMELARHGAHTFWGLLTRTAATIAAHTIVRACLTGALTTQITRLRRFHGGLRPARLQVTEPALLGARKLQASPLIGFARSTRPCRNGH